MRVGDKLAPIQEFLEEHTYFIRHISEKHEMVIEAVWPDNSGVTINFFGTVVTTTASMELAFKMREAWLKNNGKTRADDLLPWKRVEMDNGALEYMLGDQFDISVRYYDKPGRQSYYRGQWNFEETTNSYKSLPDVSSMNEAKIAAIDNLLDEVNALRKQLIAERKALKEQIRDGD
jgi:hypothetical protein